MEVPSFGTELITTANTPPAAGKPHGRWRRWVPHVLLSPFKPTWAAKNPADIPGLGSPAAGALRSRSPSN